MTPLDPTRGRMKIKLLQGNVTIDARSMPDCAELRLQFIILGFKKETDWPGIDRLILTTTEKLIFDLAVQYRDNMDDDLTLAQAIEIYGEEAKTCKWKVEN